MNNYDFKINDQATKNIWKNFERKLNSKIRCLPKNAQAEIRTEIMSHLFESYQYEKSDSPAKARLQKAIDRLGNIDEFIKPLVRDILNESSSPYSRIDQINFLNFFVSNVILKFIIMTTLGFCYFFILMTFILGCVHFYNTDAGLWISDNGGISLSFEKQENSKQWMPALFSYIAIICSFLAYIILSYITDRVIRLFTN